MSKFEPLTTIISLTCIINGVEEMEKLKPMMNKGSAYFGW
jgi:hypothetical protein